MKSDLELKKVGDLVTMYEREIGDLEEHNTLLITTLKQIKTVLDNPPNILVGINIEAGKVGRELRIYTNNGIAAGICQKVLTKNKDGDDLFSNESGTAFYEVSIDLKKIIEGR